MIIMNDMKNTEFAERFKKAVADSGLEDTQEALSRLLGVSGVMIWSYRNGEKLPRMATAVRIADKLGVDVNWLLTGKKQSLANATPTNTNLLRTIPLFIKNGVDKWLNSPAEFKASDADRWIYPPYDKHGARTFALVVQGDSMVSPFPGQKSYPDGIIIYVDPDKEVQNGSRVVAKTLDGSYVFKTYVVDMGKRYLKPINPHYPMIEITSDIIICGVVIGSYMPE